MELTLRPRFLLGVLAVLLVGTLFAAAAGAGCDHRERRRSAS